MTSIAQTPYADQARSSSSLIFPSDGLTPVYLDENIRKFEDKTTLKTERAYTLHDANKTNSNIKEIIESGRLAVLKVKNGALQGGLSRARTYIKH